MTTPATGTDGADAPVIVADETVAPGAYWTRIVDRWQRLRITDVDGRQSCSLLAYNADQTSERFNAPDTVKIQNQIFLGTGRVLFSDLGRDLHNEFHRNARDNFVMALGRHGMGRRDLVMSFNPFARVRVAPQGALEWEAGVGEIAVAPPVQGTLWRMLVGPGDVVAFEEVVPVVEGMKTEVSDSTPSPGRVRAIRCTEGALVRAGQTLVVLG